MYSPLRVAALDALAQGAATYPELERRTGRNDKSLQWALYGLEKDGVVRREKITYPRSRGKYYRLDLRREPRVRWELTGQALPDLEKYRHPLQDVVLRNMWDGCCIKDLVDITGATKKSIGCALRKLQARGQVRQELVDRAALEGDKRVQPRVRWYRV